MEAHFEKIWDYSVSEMKKMTPAERNTEIVSNLTWWEVIALVLLDNKKSSKVPQILEHPLMKARIEVSSDKHPSNAIWGQLQMHTKDECTTVNFDKNRRLEPKVFSKLKDSSWEIDETLLKDERPDLFDLLSKYKLNPGQHESKRYIFVSFHQSSCYESFVEGIVAKTNEDNDFQIQYAVEPGVFKWFCDIARRNPKEPYALFIDEINRGNVSGIFGELISLIEDDKRASQNEELTVKLLYSKEDFSVPSNLFIIGSMNTADRSIDALDSALRRRFSFVEMGPQPELLSEEPWKPNYLSINLTELLECINQRIEFLLDRDHQIGHSYFMRIRGKTREEELYHLQSVFKNQIIPLLEDYFYGNLEKVAMILGSKFIEKMEKQLTSTCLLEIDGTTDFSDKTIRRIADISKLTEDDFKTLIKK